MLYRLTATTISQACHSGCSPWALEARQMHSGLTPFEIAALVLEQDLALSISEGLLSKHLDRIAYLQNKTNKCA